MDVFLIKKNGAVVAHTDLAAMEAIDGKKTPDKTVTMKAWEDAGSQVNAWKETAKPESTFDFSSFGYIDTSEFPHFVYAQPTLGNDLQSQLFLLAGIVFVCILLFWLSFVSFIKYDVR